MIVVAKLASFSVLLLLAFVAAVAAGRELNPDKPAGLAGESHAAPDGGSMNMSSGGHGAVSAHAVRGLSVTDEGVRLVVTTPELERGKQEQISFHIVDEAGKTVRDFEPTHTKRMHLIVVRRDLTGFQHLHPAMSADGTWSVRTSLPEAGSYRVFADFLRDDEPVTLASDLRVDGGSDLRPLPAPADAATSDDGYRVHFSDRGAQPDRPSALRFTVTRDGRPVEVEPYLGASGHLVALREGDLAFLHVHPEEHASAPGAIDFESTFPSIGTYRLFLQFQHEGRVQTVAFTKEMK
ncbi:MAG: hypothetical protein Q7V62_12280 [Actinomycetota bacterium]|nr:hypothetical protein [Actinomycetota bacterium]